MTIVVNKNDKILYIGTDLDNAMQVTNMFLKAEKRDKKDIDVFMGQNIPDWLQGKIMVFNRDVLIPKKRDEILDFKNRIKVLKKEIERVSKGEKVVVKIIEMKRNNDNKGKDYMKKPKTYNSLLYKGKVRNKLRKDIMAHRLRIREIEDDIKCLEVWE